MFRKPGSDSDLLIVSEIFREMLPSLTQFYFEGWIRFSCKSDPGPVLPEGSDSGLVLI